MTVKRSPTTPVGGFLLLKGEGFAWLGSEIISTTQVEVSEPVSVRFSVVSVSG